MTKAAFKFPMENEFTYMKSTSINHCKMFTGARCWWFTPIILATQETEIRRIAILGQLGQIVLENLS
jgi:hypothetical protein